MPESPASPSLREVFEEVPDPRDPRGCRHPLPAMLTLAATAMMCGSRSLYAISQWGRDHPQLSESLGFTRKTPPCTGAFHYLFQDLDAKAFEGALTRWMTRQGAVSIQQEVLHLDGKTLRGSGGHQVAGVHLLAAYADRLGSSLAQLRVDAKTNEHKAALELLKIVPVKGALVTGDAMFAQKEVCQQITDEGGDYFFPVKDNQPTLKQDILAAFEGPFSPSGVEPQAV